MSNYYEYKELKAKAIAPNSTQEDVDRLGRWFEQHGHQYWNGKAFLVEKDLFLKPVYKPIYAVKVEELYSPSKKEASDILKPIKREIMGFEFVGVNAPWRKNKIKSARWRKFNDGWFTFRFCSNCGYRTMDTCGECPACKSFMLNKVV